jgi:hypothetical protein
MTVSLTVQNPVAELNSETSPRAARAIDLSALRLGLWWNQKVGGEVALEWLGGELEGEFGVSVYKSYGSYPATDERLAATTENSDIVIGSTGDCGSCTTWLIHDLIELERRGVPTVALVAREFVEDARQTAFVFGMPDLALVELPRGLTNLTPAEVVELAREARPGVITALTDVSGATSDQKPLPSPIPAEFTYEGGDQLAALAAFQRDFLERQLGDGFPLVAPTRAAVDEMLTGTSLSADRVIAVLHPGLGQATVEKIAVNAVMAGCSPEHLPVLLAATEALAADEFCLRTVAMSTGPHAPLLIVNGPIAKQLQVNSGRGALGPSSASAANVVLGRALRLVMVNCGYDYLGIFDMDTIGAPRKFSFCIAENEDESPFEPFHVDRGFGREESTVTVFSVESESECSDMGNYDAESLLRTYAGTIPQPGPASVQCTYLERIHGKYTMHSLLLVPPDHAKVVADAGWSKREATDYVYKQSFREAQWILNAIKPQALRPDKLWAAELEGSALIPAVDGPEALELVVVGGAGPKGQFLHGLSVPVTRSIARYLPGVESEGAVESTLKEVAR